LGLNFGASNIKINSILFTFSLTVVVTIIGAYKILTCYEFKRIKLPFLFNIKAEIKKNILKASPREESTKSEIKI